MKINLTHIAFSVGIFVLLANIFFREIFFGHNLIAAIIALLVVLFAIFKRGK
jgi:hypothetical protein